jgi:hypothetical protein
VVEDSVTTAAYGTDSRVADARGTRTRLQKRQFQPGPEEGPRGGTPPPS